MDNILYVNVTEPIIMTRLVYWIKTIIIIIINVLALDLLLGRNHMRINILLTIIASGYTVQ